MDGALVPRDAASLPADDGAYREGRGCYTTARWDGAHLRLGGRAARRLVRDAARLGLGELEEEDCRTALETLAAAAFGRAEGIVRLQASRDGAGRVHLVGLPRDVGPEPDPWRGVSAPFPHEGPAPWSGAKVTNHLRLAWAREHATSAGAHEALLFDPAGRLVEGSRTNAFVVLADGRLVTPPLTRGAVAGVARELLCEAAARGELDLEETDVGRDDLVRAREIVVTNSVRGARALAELDGEPVADGGTGPTARRLDALLEAAARAPAHG